MRTSKVVQTIAPLTVALIVTAGSQLGSGQQTVPFQGGIPVAPLGLSGKPLPKLPVVLDTAEGMRVRVSAVARGLENPWSIAFLPDGTLLVTERIGRLRIIRNGVLDPQPVAGTPKALRRRRVGAAGRRARLHGRGAAPALRGEPAGLSQLHQAARREAQTRPPSRAAAGTARRIADMKDIFVADERTGGAVRLAFGRDGTLYLTTTGNDAAGSEHARPARCCGSRTTAPSRPTTRSSARPDHKPEVFTLGHRSSLGLAMHPGTGEIWQNENGPNGGDEINILKPGANYGWPVVSYGRTYPGAVAGRPLLATRASSPRSSTGCRRSPCRA